MHVILYADKIAFELLFCKFSEIKNITKSTITINSEIHHIERALGRNSLVEVAAV